MKGVGVQMLRTKVFKEVCESCDLNKRINELNNNLANNSEDINSLRELGVIYHYQKKDKDAINLYRKIIEIVPDNANVKAFLGYLHYELDELDDAIDYLNDSLDLDPGAPFVYFLLGNAYSRAGMIKEAIESYEFAIFLDFDMYTAHLDFAKKYEDMGRKEKSLKEYIAAYEIDSRDASIKEKIDILYKEICS
jgi:tetratricopeptide (TPR) repeat protein